jgi:hypothetical protein
VATNSQVDRLARSLDVQAAHAHARVSTGQPFVEARSEVNGKFYSADENALIALHKMRLHMGSPAEIAGRKAWLRGQGSGSSTNRCSRWTGGDPARPGVELSCHRGADCLGHLEGLTEAPCTLSSLDTHFRRASRRHDR